MKHAVTYEVVQVTPELAAQWLALNVHNRSLRERVVARYADDMKAGRWPFTGAPIKFDWDGNLQDGQHRLAAQVRSGATVEHLVIRGVDPAAQDVTDVGPSRTLGDALKLKGESNYVILASSLRYFWLEIESRPFDSSTADRPSITQALQILAATPEARDGASKAATLRPHIPMSPAVIAYRWCRFGDIDTEDRDDFFHRLHVLSFRGESDPLRHFASHLHQNSTRNKRRYSTVDLHALLVKTWNFYRQGNEIKSLAWKRGGSLREDFPEAI